MATQTKHDAIGRAEYLLEVVAEFIDANPVSEYTTIYDDAECDGSCLAEDCKAAAEELRLIMKESYRG